jgi:hemerythrin-like domain-containing protein
LQATKILRDEHEGILTMLAIVEAAADRVRDGKPVPSDLFSNAADFFSNFADKCHHGKEENRLFPTMVQYGVPNEGGPVGVMLAEHVHGRALLRAMREAAERYAGGDASVASALAKTTLEYANFLRTHIAKENNMLFPMADQLIPEAEQLALAQFYDEFEATVMGAGVHERYHAMIDEYKNLAASWH